MSPLRKAVRATTVHESIDGSCQSHYSPRLSYPLSVLMEIATVTTEELSQPLLPSCQMSPIELLSEQQISSGHPSTFQ